MTSKKLILAAMAVLLNSAIAFAEPKVVAITAIVEHPALNAVRDGVVEELAKQGFKDGETVKIVFESAQGQPSVAGQIARQFVGQKPDVIVAISTPSAQAMVAATRTIPVIFTAVTDPVGAGLVKSVGTGNKNVTGVSDQLPIDEQIKLIKEVTPKATKIGVIYNPGEANSVSTVNELKEAAAKQDMEVIEAPAMKTSEVQSAARSLIGKADVMYSPSDNTIMSALESVVVVAQSAKIPYFTADTNSVSRGSLASIGFSYHQLGIETGKIVVRVLNGENTNTMPVVFPKDFEIFLNKSAAEKSGVVLSEDLIGRATKVID